MIKRVKAFIKKPIVLFSLLSLIKPALSCLLNVFKQTTLWESPLLIYIALIHVFGITSIILYSLIANRFLFQTSKLISILAICVIVGLISAWIGFLTPAQLGSRWLMSYLQYSLLFSVLPAVVTVLIKYALWRRKKGTE